MRNIAGQDPPKSYSYTTGLAGIRLTDFKSANHFSVLNNLSQFYFLGIYKH